MHCRLGRKDYLFEQLLAGSVVFRNANQIDRRTRNGVVRKTRKASYKQSVNRDQESDPNPDPNSDLVSDHQP